MLKLISVDSEFFHEEPVIQVLDLQVANGLVKAAADSRVNEFISSIVPSVDKTYVHILAMGAGEYFGSNRNADYFPESNLEKFHQTFVTSPAHIFKHHINKDPSIAMGQVVFAVYNERMHRVEVIAWIDKEKGKEVVAKIDRGEFPATSMACHTPYDTCSICGNKARSRAEYCVHLKNELGRIYPDGRRVMAINDGPLRFFDMSIVFKPADVTSSVLQKVAFVESPTQPVVGSAEMADIYSLVEKKAAMKKLSELIKEVEGSVVGASDTLSGIIAKAKDPEDELIETLASHDLHEVIAAMAEFGISPSIGFFAKLIGRKICGQDVSGIEHLVRGYVQDDSGDLKIPRLEPTDVQPDPGLMSKVASISKASSIYPEMILHRSLGEPDGTYASGMGYTGLGPHVEPDPRMMYRNLKAEHKEGDGLLRTLVTIAASAIAAKWLLSRMIESKMQEIAKQQQGSPNIPAKILLVKSANEAVSTGKLSQYSLLASLKGLY